MSETKSPRKDIKFDEISSINGTSGQSKGKQLLTISNSTNICTTISPLISKEQYNNELVDQIKPFKVRNIINAVNSSKLSEKLNLSSKRGGLLTNTESQSFVNEKQGNFIEKEEDILEKKTPKLSLIHI